MSDEPEEIIPDTEEVPAEPEEVEPVVEVVETVEAEVTEEDGEKVVVKKEKKAKKGDLTPKELATSLDLAYTELEKRVIPITIRRVLPNGDFQNISIDLFN